VKSNLSTRVVPSLVGGSLWLASLGALQAQEVPSATTASPGTSTPTASSGAPLTQQVRAEFEGLFASDLQLTQSSVSYGLKRGGWELNAGVSTSTYDLDYAPAPFDFLGSATDLSERRIAGSLGGRVKVFEPLTLLVNGGLYDGFNDYRSVWLNEYFRQQFSEVGGFGDSYTAATPRGENLNVGLRWEYLPTVGFVQGDVTYAHDEIAPGYEIDFDGLRRGRSQLYTASYHVALENILTRRIRVLNEFRLTDTTNRRNRYGYQGSINVALADRWVLRAFGGYTQEDPTFEARYYGGTVEYEPATGWLISVSGRHYQDTGEIENTLFSSAAPGLDAWQVGVGVRRVWGVHSLKVFVAPYFTRYQPAGIGTAFFQNLYQDRDWGTFQVAYAAEF
jgi:hypothetical protein